MVADSNQVAIAERLTVSRRAAG